MNIYDYLVSPDIAEHCMKIGHTFNSLEMAAIVEMSNKTLKEKISAWQKIITDFPDIPILDEPSLHEFLRKYIAHKEMLQEEFLKTGEGIYYTIAGYSRSNASLNGLFVGWDPGGFPTLEEAWNKKRKVYRWTREKFAFGHAEKKKLYSDISIDAIINYDAEIVEISDSDGVYGNTGSTLLSDIFVYIPVPFTRGDIVISSPDSYNFHLSNKIFVLESLPHWQSDIYSKYISSEHISDEDLKARYYYMNHNNMLLRIRGDEDIGYQYKKKYGYYDLEYYKGEPEGCDRFLNYLSRYVKNGENNLPELLNTYYLTQSRLEHERALDSINFNCVDLDIDIP